MKKFVIYHKTRYIHDEQVNVIMAALKSCEVSKTGRYKDCVNYRTSGLERPCY